MDWYRYNAQERKGSSDLKTISFVLAFSVLAILLCVLPTMSAQIVFARHHDNGGSAGSNDNSGSNGGSSDNGNSNGGSNDNSGSSSSQPTCPSGYSLSSDGTTCNLDQSQQQQQPTCPTGYSLSSDGTTCTSDQPSTPTCPSGYTLSSDQKTCNANSQQHGGPDLGKIANDVKNGVTIIQGLCTGAHLLAIPAPC